MLYPFVGGYIFNTEAHPIDPAALHCCSRRAQDMKKAVDILNSLAVNPSKNSSRSESGDLPSAKLLTCELPQIDSVLNLYGAASKT